MVGYPIKDLDAIELKYICPECKLILRDPVQSTICAHRQCQSCVEKQRGEMIICAECGEKISRNELKPDRGFKNDMQILLINCRFCHWNGKLKDYQAHLDQDHSKPICNYCQTQFQSINDLISHQQFECSQITVQCPLHPIGCADNISRKDLAEHYKSYQHQYIIMNFLRTISKTNSQRQTIDFRQINETITKLLNDVQISIDHIQQIENIYNQTNDQFQSIVQDLSVVKQTNDEQNIFIENLIPNQDNLLKELRQYQQIVKGIQCNSNEGMYILRIDNVQEKMATARSDAQSWIESSPFFSSPTGYKMLFRLYLNGDNQARNTHLSIHFILMRGEFDAIINFPFCFKLYICLYNQIDSQKHLIHCFQPNVTLEHFRRPHSEMNTPYPISKFASLNLLYEENNPFIRDNTMFIKIFIDFRQIPEHMIGFVSSLNPIYSISMQQSMIEDERNKQTT